MFAVSAAVTPLASTNIIALAVEDYPVYHSLYDDYVWMERFGDPLFHRHVACTELVVVQRFFISLQTLTDSFVLLA